MFGTYYFKLRQYLILWNDTELFGMYANLRISCFIFVWDWSKSAHSTGTLQQNRFEERDQTFSVDNIKIYVLSCAMGRDKNIMWGMENKTPTALWHLINDFWFPNWWSRTLLSSLFFQIVYLRQWNNLFYLSVAFKCSTWNCQQNPLKMYRF